jgi:hypothetical protein
LGTSGWSNKGTRLAARRRVHRVKFRDKLKKLKFGDKEIEFRDIPQLPAGDKKPAEETPQLAAQQKALPTPAIEQAPAAEPALVDYAPTGAFVNAWARMEDTMRREVERLSLTDGTTLLAARSLASRLVRADVIEDRAAEVIIQLSDLRNRVVHEASRPLSTRPHSTSRRSMRGSESSRGVQIAFACDSCSKSWGPVRFKRFESAPFAVVALDRPSRQRGVRANFDGASGRLPVGA